MPKKTVPERAEKLKARQEFQNLAWGALRAQELDAKDITPEQARVLKSIRLANAKLARAQNDKRIRLSPKEWQLVDVFSVFRKKERVRNSVNSVLAKFMTNTPLKESEKVMLQDLLRALKKESKYRTAYEATLAKAARKHYEELGIPISFAMDPVILKKELQRAMRTDSSTIKASRGLLAKGENPALAKYIQSIRDSVGAEHASMPHSISERTLPGTKRPMKKPLTRFK